MTRRSLRFRLLRVSAVSIILALLVAGLGLAALFERHGALLEAALRAPVTAGGMWLVRPDGYVALVEKRGDVAAVSEYLDRIAA